MEAAAEVAAEPAAAASHAEVAPHEVADEVADTSIVSDDITPFTPKGAGASGQLEVVEEFDTSVEDGIEVAPSSGRSRVRA